MLRRAWVILLDRFKRDAAETYMVVHKREKPKRASCCLVGHCLTAGAFNQTLDIRVTIILEHR